MKSRIQFVSGLVVAGLLAGMVMAEGDAHGKAAAPKAKSYKGTLAAKPADAEANVVAVLTVKAKDKETVYNIIAADEAVTGKINALVEKGGEVAIKGVASEDGKSITASAATAAVAAQAKPKAPKAEKKPAAEEAPAME